MYLMILTYLTIIAAASSFTALSYVCISLLVKNVCVDLTQSNKLHARLRNILVASCSTCCSEVRLLWDFNVYIDRMIDARRPDANVIDDKCEKLVDVCYFGQ